MSRGVKFWKMSGAGNDFIVLGPPALRIAGDRPADWVRRICRRRTSVGADGVVFVEPLSNGRVGVRYHNKDGSVAFCGNGSRCAARFAFENEYAGAAMVLDTAAGEVPAELARGRVRLTLPAPRDDGPLDLQVEGRPLAGRLVHAGVPHFLVEVDDAAAAPLERWGSAVRRHPDLGEEGANFDVVERRVDGSLAVRTWERGVEGETLACGSGAVAAAYFAGIDGLAERTRVVPVSGIALDVTLPGGAGSASIAVLEGDARRIFEGRFDEEAVCGPWTA